MFEKLKSAKNYVVEHRTVILFCSLMFTTAGVVLLRGGIAQHDEFLKQHNLYEEFYAQVD